MKQKHLTRLIYHISKSKTYILCGLEIITLDIVQTWNNIRTFIFVNKILQDFSISIIYLHIIRSQQIC